MVFSHLFRLFNHKRKSAQAKCIPSITDSEDFTFVRILYGCGIFLITILDEYSRSTIFSQKSQPYRTWYTFSFTFSCRCLAFFSGHPLHPLLPLLTVTYLMPHSPVNPFDCCQLVTSFDRCLSRYDVHGLTSVTYATFIPMPGVLS